MDVYLDSTVVLRQMLENVFKILGVQGVCKHAAAHGMQPGGEPSARRRED